MKASEKMGVKVMQRWEELAYEREDGVEEGLREGAKALIETCQEIGWSKEEIKRKLLQKLAISEENAEIYLEEFYEE